MMTSRHTTLLVVGAALVGCAADGAGPATDASPFGARPEVEIATTSETIARANLDFAIETDEAAYADRPTAALAAKIAATRLARARFYGIHSDFDRAQALAEAHPESPALQAQVLSTLHHFAEAEAILEGLEPTPSLDLAAVRVALGIEGLSADLEAATVLRPDYRTHLLAGAAVTMEGRFVDADDHFVAALTAYRDAAPFPVAAARFQRGVMWAEVAGDDALGRRMYERALDAVPGYVTATVHLAELEWSGGDTAAAIARLQAVLPTTEDPEPFGLLGEILAEEGDLDAAEALVAEADRRYQSLLERHPEAFWDHASEFYSGPGAAPEQALEYAEANLANRATERAHLLVISAAEAAGRLDRACEVAAQLDAEQVVTAELAEWIASAACP